MILVDANDVEGMQSVVEILQLVRLGQRCILRVPPSNSTREPSFENLVLLNRVGAVAAPHGWREFPIHHLIGVVSLLPLHVSRMD
jgi:hypothetical protein